MPGTGDRRSELAEALRTVRLSLAEQDRTLTTAPVVVNPADPHGVTPLPGAPPDVAAADVDAARGIVATRARQLRRAQALERRLRGVDEQTEDLHRSATAALEWLNGLANPDELLADVQTDPALSRDPGDRIDARAATTILRVRNRRHGGAFPSFEDVAALTALTSAMIADLLFTGFQRLARAAPSTTVGVLLPVRLETRFRQDGSSWVLRLRIVPDEPWFARHDPLAAAVELDSLERYLADVALATDQASKDIAWRAFTARHRPARCAWLVRTFPATSVDADGRPRVTRPSELRDEPFFPRVNSLPETLEVWMARGGLPPSRAATLPVDAARLRLDFGDPGDPSQRRWWESWDEAVAAGLAAEIGLGTRADDIDVLYVVGLGATAPSQLFADHRDAGTLGLLTPGTPTNTVEGEPAGALADDPATWWSVLTSAASEDTRQVARALTGDPDLLGALPGQGDTHQFAAHAFTAGLWSALWGHALTDVLGLGSAAEQVAGLAAQHLFPEGPFPTLRIAEQPYGLLPVTSLAAWQPAPGDPAVEAALVSLALWARPRWAAAAEASGTVEGASAERLLDIVSQLPTSPAYQHRPVWPLESWLLFLVALGYQIDGAALEAAWRDAAPALADLGLDPPRKNTAQGHATRLRIPLVIPAELPGGDAVGKVIQKLVTVARQSPRLFARTDTLVSEILRFQPNSLLLRLIIRSLQVSIGDVGRDVVGDPTPAVDPPVLVPSTQPLLQRWIMNVAPADLLSGSRPAERFLRVASGLDALAGLPEELMERLLVATVDSASHRIDPWVTLPALRRLGERLDGVGATPATELRLGAYGWVDRPAPGRPGPTDGGLLHAPSDTQAMTAVLLRDRALSDPEPARWKMQLSSRTVRTADRLGAQVRTGLHLVEALGREVERIVATPAAVNRLREQFPIRAAHAGRRVCDGQAVLEADPASLGLSPAALTELDELRRALDAYSDLLLADAVHGIVSGRTDAAASPMDAAAGLGPPPSLDVLRTRRAGRTVQTRCVVAIPHVAAPGIPADLTARSAVSPVMVADAAAGALVDEALGAAITWTWKLESEDGTTETVTLADIGLSPAESLALSRGDLERLVRDAGADPEATLTGAGGSERHGRAERLIALLGRQPAAGDDLAAVDVPVDPALDADLRDRLTRLRAVAEALRARIAAARGMDDATRTAALAAARRWGIAPEPDPEVADPLDSRLEQAARLLDDRLTRTPDPAAAASLDRSTLVDAITSLASPTGRVAILGRAPLSALPVLQRHADLDSEWLTVVAAVRRSLARLEAHQLKPPGGSPLAAWSNRATDPWQTDASDRSRLIAVYTPGTLDLSATPATAMLAVGLTDRFEETVPLAGHTTGAAFGFDAPSSRAPQAILLAVPPDLHAPLSPATIVQCVAETRELAHARMALPGDLGAEPLIPTVLMPSAGPVMAPLDPVAS